MSRSWVANRSPMVRAFCAEWSHPCAQRHRFTSAVRIWPVIDNLPSAGPSGGELRVERRRVGGEARLHLAGDVVGKDLESAGLDAVDRLATLSGVDFGPPMPAVMSVST
jgi:hypothetical protein